MADRFLICHFDETRDMRLMEKVLLKTLPTEDAL